MQFSLIKGCLWFLTAKILIKTIILGLPISEIMQPTMRKPLKKLIQGKVNWCFATWSTKCFLVINGIFSRAENIKPEEIIFPYQLLFFIYSFEIMRRHRQLSEFHDLNKQTNNKRGNVLSPGIETRKIRGQEKVLLLIWP